MIGRFCHNPYLSMPLYFNILTRIIQYVGVKKRTHFATTKLFNNVCRGDRIFCLQTIWQRWVLPGTSQWRHNESDGVSNHQPHDRLPNRLFRRRWKKTSKPRVAGLCGGNSPVTPVNSPHKGPVTRIFFPFDDVIMSDETWTAPM